MISNAVAETGAPERPRTMKKTELYTELSRARIEAILGEPIPEVNFFQVPLREVLVELKKLTGIDMYFDPEELGDMIDPDAPIDVEAAGDSMTFKTLIEEFILGPNDLVFVIRDNFLRVMSYDKSLTQYEFAVYNCRDLLVGRPAQRAAAAQIGDSGVEETFSDIGAREQQLIEIIRSMLASEDSPWDDRAGAFHVDMIRIEAFNGMLVIRARRKIQEQVRQLLRLLREGAKQQDWPADLGDWPHKKRIVPAGQGAIVPAEGGGFGGGGQGFF